MINRTGQIWTTPFNSVFLIIDTNWMHDIIWLYSNETLEIVSKLIESDDILFEFSPLWKKII